MRKNAKKLVALAIFISAISGSIIPAFAEDSIGKNTIVDASAQAGINPILTLDDAIKAAISNSDTLALDVKKINYQNNFDEVNEKIDDFNNVDEDEEDFNDDSREATLDQLRQQKDCDEDIVIEKVTNIYNNIVTNQIEIDKAAKELEIKIKELDDAKVRKELGFLTLTDLKNTELQIEKLKNEQKANVNALKDAEYSFKVLIGKDITKYSLEQDVEYEKLKIDDSIDEYLDKVIEKYKKYDNQLVKLKKDYLKDNKVEEITDSDKPSVLRPKREDYTSYEDYKNALDEYEDNIIKYTDTLSSRLIYLNSKLDIYTQETTLKETKKQFKEQLRTFYTNLLTTEDNINALKESIELNNKYLRDAKLKWDLGMITKSEYDELSVNAQDLELQLRRECINYNVLKKEIQNPWIAFSNSY